MIDVLMGYENYTNVHNIYITITRLSHTNIYDCESIHTENNEESYSPHIHRNTCGSPLHTSCRKSVVATVVNQTCTETNAQNGLQTYA
ncbi:unnamed protein product [Trichobilharzia szidati]|nr:unnamed protein product [Trichobilharzia szidati]